MAPDLAGRAPANAAILGFQVIPWESRMIDAATVKAIALALGADPRGPAWRKDFKPAP